MRGEGVKGGGEDEGRRGEGVEGLRAGAVPGHGRGEDEALATPGAWRGVVCRVRGARRSRSGSLHMERFISRVHSRVRISRTL